MASISRAADVPEPTVYRLFSSKVGILRALLDVSIAGDDEPITVVDRPSVATLLDADGVDAVLDGFANVTTSINRRTSEVYDVVRRAADAEPEAASLFADIGRQRDQGQGQIVRTLHRKRALRSGLSEREASDIVHAIMAPEVYRLLVHDRGWSPLHYQQWAARTLKQQLTAS